VYAQLAAAPASQIDQSGGFVDRRGPMHTRASPPASRGTRLLSAVREEVRVDLKVATLQLNSHLVVPDCS